MDQRKEWLQAIADTFAWDVIPRVAAVLCRNTGVSGQCELTRRCITKEAGVHKNYAYERAMRDLEDAGFVYRENPGAPSRVTAVYSLVLAGTFIAGGDEGSAPQLKPERSWRYKVATRDARASVRSLSQDDPKWAEQRPYCGHTMRTCTPDCPDWGGRTTGSDFGLLEGYMAGSDFGLLEGRKAAA